jgi:cytochrome c5
VAVALAAGLLAAGRPATRARATHAAGPSYSPRRPALAKHLPDGVGRDVAETRCLMCHSAMLVAQQHKDSTGWEKTVHQMELWSAPIPPGDRDTLFAYLLAHFGPRAAAPTH